MLNQETANIFYRHCLGFREQFDALWLPNLKPSLKSNPCKRWHFPFLCPSPSLALKCHIVMMMKQGPGCAFPGWCSVWLLGTFNTDVLEEGDTLVGREEADIKNPRDTGAACWASRTSLETGRKEQLQETMEGKGKKEKNANDEGG